MLIYMLIVLVNTFPLFNNLFHKCTNLNIIWLMLTERH